MDDEQIDPFLKVLSRIALALEKHNAITEDMLRINKQELSIARHGQVTDLLQALSNPVPVQEQAE